MSVKLAFENGGMIKEYSTWRLTAAPEGSDCDHSGYTRGETKCGLYFEKYRPNSLPEGCAHLDCALWAAEKTESDDMSGATAVFLLCSFLLLLLSGIFGGNLFVIIFIIFVVIFWLLVFKSHKKIENNLSELTEFVDEGTVRGIKARLIQPAPSEAGGPYVDAEKME